MRLATSDRQREILDRFAGADLADRSSGYRSRYAERRAAGAELDRLRAEALARARRSTC